MGQFQCHEDVSLGRLLTGETVTFFLQVCPLASGTDVPIYIEVSYTEKGKQPYERTISTSLQVIKKDETVPTYTFNNPSFSGGFAGRDYTGNVTHNHAQEVNLAKAAQDIQDLLVQLDRSYPTKTKEEKQTAIVKKIEQHIKRDPALKDKLWNALKTGSVEALKQTLDGIYKNPAVSISVEAIKGFLEAEYRE
ncbi:MAG: hypothetical protein V7L31_25115 [Nostoc sp.]|uniref:hypothetical protein n=1 Tax=Nostoc sp. TaxID=1180 RepID=UPI002FEF2A89